MRRLAAGLALLLLTGCGLPLTDGTRSGAGSDERNRAIGIKVLPPGPQAGASAEQVVRGFLAAQVSPDDDFAVARQFLAPDATWVPEGIVELLDPGSETLTVLDDPSQVRFQAERSAQLSPAGAHRLRDGQTTPVVFQVEPQPGGELRISAAPSGLRLRSSDLDTSFDQHDVFFLGRLTPDEASSRLVADRRFLRRGGDTARALVTALVDGPSDGLGESAERLVPEGTRVLGTGVDEDRVVTADLSDEVAQLSRRDRQRLSAALVWTLQDYEGVRLLVEGRPLDLAPLEEVQTVEDWAEYDPSGLPGATPLRYVEDRRLFVARGAGGQGDATSGAVAVDEVAVDPAGARLAVLTQGATPEAPDELRLGGVEGPLDPPALSAPGLGSLSWGSGERGLWVLQTGAVGSRLLLLPEAGSSPGAPAVEVPVPTPAGAGPLTRAEVSRDGVRIALVFGAGERRRLHVGRLEPGGAGLAVVDVQAVAPDLLDVTDLAWESGTSLAVLARDQSAAGLLVLQVAVDGSGSAPLPRPGLTGEPVAIAAAPGLPLAVAVAVPGRPTTLYVDDGEVFASLGQGSAPTYPG